MMLARVSNASVLAGTSTISRISSLWLADCRFSDPARRAAPAVAVLEPGAGGTHRQDATAHGATGEHEADTGDRDGRVRSNPEHRGAGWIDCRSRKSVHSCRAREELPHQRHPCRRAGAGRAKGRRARLAESDGDPRPRTVGRVACDHREAFETVRRSDYGVAGGVEGVHQRGAGLQYLRPPTALVCGTGDSISRRTKTNRMPQSA